MVLAAATAVATVAAAGTVRVAMAQVDTALELAVTELEQAATELALALALALATEAGRAATTIAAPHARRNCNANVFPALGLFPLTRVAEGHMLYKTSFSLFVASLLCITAVGCRKKVFGDSKAHSVDAIVSGDETQRQALYCGSGAKVSPSKTPEEAVDQVFKRLPRLFTTAFPTLRDQIKLDSLESVNTLCKSIFTAQVKDLFDNKDDEARALSRLENLGACWSFTVGDKADVSVPTIHLTKDVDAVHHNMIAMVTYGIVELYADRVGDYLDGLSEKDRKVVLEKVKVPGQPVTTGDEMTFVTKLRDYRLKLATAVVEDLKNLSKTDVLQGYVDAYRLKSFDELKTSRFTQNIFLAESVESYYCSDESRKLFGTRQMTATLKVMDELDAFLNP